MISPTGRGIRNDGKGGGAYGALRGYGRLHKGMDFLCTPLQKIVAPFDMVVKRIAYPYEGKNYSGIKWETEQLEGKMFYFEPYTYKLGQEVRQGTALGLAQDISTKYGKEMKPHIHFQIDRLDPQVLIDLTKFAKDFS